MLKLADGDPTSVGKETVNGVEYDAWVYPYYTAYRRTSKVKTWKQTQSGLRRRDREGAGVL